MVFIGHLDLCQFFPNHYESILTNVDLFNIYAVVTECLLSLSGPPRCRLEFEAPLEVLH